MPKKQKTTSVPERGIRVFAIISVIWGATINLLLFPRFDVDLYHDGFIYPMALLASQGGIPNKDFFSIYGPIGPLIQGKWLDFFGANLINLRLHGAFLILIISLLMFNLMKSSLGSNRSLLLTSIWMVGNPLIVHPSLPWVDLYTTMILLIAAVYIKYIGTKRDLVEKDFLVLGAFLTLGMFSKVNFAVPMVGIFFLTTLIIGVKKGLFYSLGATFTVSFFLTTMQLNGTLRAYLEQGVIFTLNMHDDGKSLRGIFNLKIVIFGLGVLGAFLLIERFSHKLESKRYLLNSIMLFVASTMILVAHFFRDLDVPFTAFTKDFSKDFSNLLKNSPYALLFASVFFALISIALVFFKHKDFRLKNTSVLISIIGFSSVLQLYPNPEPAHIWYVFPIAVVGSVIWAPTCSSKTKESLYSKLTLVPFFLALATINIEYISIDRQQHVAKPLIGMMSREGRTPVIDNTLIELKSKIGPRSVQYNCPLGIYSVANNLYKGSDYQYVDIIPKFYIPKAQSDLIFSCDLSLAEATEIRRNYVLLFETHGPWPYGINILYKTPQH